jgi:hypothetical protein
VIALPVAAQVPLATLAMATPLTPGVIAVGVFAQGVWDRIRGRPAAADRVAWGPTIAAPGSAAGRDSRTGLR